MNRREDKQVVEVPKGAGIAGFLMAIEEILKLPHVQGVHIDAKGKVSYTRFLKENEEVIPLQIDFSTLSPYAVIRNSDVTEIGPAPLSAARTTGLLFRRAVIDRLYPIAFVGGANSDVWRWLQEELFGEPPTKEEFFGFPFYTDRMIEDYMLFLCVGYSRNGALIDTQKAYKIIIPSKRELGLEEEMR